MTMLQKVFRHLFNGFEKISALFMATMVIIVFVQVVLRYIFKSGIYWGEEVSTLLMVWFGFIGIAIGVIEKLHISIEMFTNFLNRRGKNLVIRFGYLLIFIFGILMIKNGFEIMKFASNVTLPSTKWPLAVVYLALPVSGLLVTVNAFIVAIGKEDYFIGNKLDKEEEYHA